MSKKVSLVSATKRQEEFVRGGGDTTIDTAGSIAVPTEIHTDVSTEIKKKATFNLDAGLHKRLKITAAQQEREMVEIVEEALEIYLRAIPKG